MDTAIIVAIIAGVCNIFAIIISSSTDRKAMDAKLDKAQAITETKLEALTAEVRKHNSFAERIPVIEERQKVANHRIDDIERRVEDNERRAC